MFCLTAHTQLSIVIRLAALVGQTNSSALPAARSPQIRYGGELNIPTTRSSAAARLSLQVMRETSGGSENCAARDSSGGGRTRLGWFRQTVYTTHRPVSGSWRPCQTSSSTLSASLGLYCRLRETKRSLSLLKIYNSGETFVQHLGFVLFGVQPGLPCFLICMLRHD